MSFSALRCHELDFLVWTVVILLSYWGRHAKMAHWARATHPFKCHQIMMCWHPLKMPSYLAQWRCPLFISIRDPPLFSCCLVWSCMFLTFYFMSSQQVTVSSFGTMCNCTISKYIDPAVLWVVFIVWWFPFCRNCKWKRRHGTSASSQDLLHQNCCHFAVALCHWAEGIADDRWRYENKFIDDCILINTNTYYRDWFEFLCLLKYKKWWRIIIFMMYCIV